MANVCEICGRIETDSEEQETENEWLHICSACMADRAPANEELLG